ncbi:hypothetical protein GE21DRAFT_9619 [Neurospora crassa]|uniref:Na(+)/H(+) antiporter 1 n=1 Tax=Neurospora crassa (strain ATCC 24698 / 74-OR23-1A / CBS 708.71 / DSM 1257 / FGSC 987) TaxID=367110 RepID=V5IKW5_NEUCR|nr:Na(+)/H(+) antiporter 1 [Neurospora crassa OR74A]ESA42328.1 Na(+)/H(+) antiporter 1 [Neurospora crassa OR74A]KHE78587.1 hypothetical protein GE21DRAFT_9619 [Neurospora crassa]|eukprot:XP_011395069.1 Na(+)/H(+) antiporter 1 [Neurospora crassa OR74A]
MNWKGEFLREAEARHDEINSCMNASLNFGGFMNNGLIMPWSESRRYHRHDVGRPDRPWLLRPPLPPYPRHPWHVQVDAKRMQEPTKRPYLWDTLVLSVPALYLYVANTRHLYSDRSHGDEEETYLVRVMIPAVYFHVLLSIVLDGLSMPGLNLIYEICGVESIMDDAVVVRRKSVRAPTPVNAEVKDNRTFVAYNRSSKPLCEPSELPIVEERYIGHMYCDGGRAVGRSGGDA